MCKLTDVIWLFSWPAGKKKQDNLVEPLLSPGIWMNRAKPPSSYGWKQRSP